MRPGRMTMDGGGWPKPGPAVKALLAALLGAYVIQLLLVRSGHGGLVQALKLTPALVWSKGWLWQPLTYLFLHDENQPWHLLSNMLWLWLFGAPLERWWRTPRFLVAYFVFGLAGALLTLLFGLWPAFAAAPHAGASGAVIGLTVAWGLVQGEQTMNFLFVGAMKARTFVLIVIGIELLTALSLAPVSSTSHFGGIIAAFVLLKGLWRPSTWGGLLRRRKLVAEKRRVERELQLIQGGKGEGGKGGGNPKDWN